MKCFSSVLIILVFLFQMTSALAMPKRIQEPQVFNAVLRFIPKELDSRRTIGIPHYFIFRHLGLPPIRLNPDGGISGALLKSWEISPDFTKFTLNIGEHKFSDGSVIEAADLAATLEASKQSGEASHFDFRKIKSVTTTSTRQVVVALTAPSQYFLEQIVQPEFGVVPKSEAFKPLYKRDYRVTSGAYSLEKFDEEGLLLVRNKYFKEWIESSPERVHVSSSMSPIFKKIADAGEIGFIQESIYTTEVFRGLVQRGHVIHSPRVSQSHFVTINHTVEALRSLENRRFVQKVAMEADYRLERFNTLFERAGQIFYRFGQSTLTQSEEKDLFDVVTARKKPSGFPEKISMGTSNMSLFGEALVGQFKKYGVQVDFTEVRVGTPIAEALKFDMALVNSDFAGKDVLENLQVAFAAPAPAIRVSKSFRLEGMMAEAEGTPRGHERQSVVKKIGLKLLDEAYVAPIAYENKNYAVPGNRDLSFWSQLFHDVALWRLPLKSANGKAK